jgi:hypothetical protein
VEGASTFEISILERASAQIGMQSKPEPTKHLIAKVVWQRPMQTAGHLVQAGIELDGLRR